MRANGCEVAPILAIIIAVFVAQKWRMRLHNVQTNTVMNNMDTTQKVRTCFTITFTDEQYSRAKGYIEDMKKHPHRIFWQGKQGKTDDELIIEQIAHRILSGFYNNEPFNAAKHIMRMDSSTKV
jgi:hypothetical protein